jgi:hypothetical protein
MIDVHRMKAPGLMALGGWENINTVNNRYFRSGAENTADALEALEDEQG